MRRRAATSFLSACAITLVAAGCASVEAERAEPAGQDVAEAGSGSTPADARGLTARLVDAEGAEVGTVTLSETGRGTRVSVKVAGLPPGFHGFHVHAVGLCEPDSVSPTDPSMTGDFLSAGGHLGAAEADHPHHAGDLPSLYIGQSGAGKLRTVTDAFTLADLTDDDGSAVMVHAGPDNFANIPERYAPEGPDQMTRATGDSGGRIACGPVEG
ncbi:superoxide dismutase family protein [Blastococcus mobilis]|uniref:Superoxide dismutase [Cu-Zn] n=1 Tax=Blastococcus mobilis TaxID=1938746 RepID=A0A239AIQ9_9ACTN|nr:superoxide dismutase family protein [Blastococcus mobilis]SNR95547.1 superoxide dismutase, Cu-Zn family [Blastococcus mobilis]